MLYFGNTQDGIFGHCGQINLDLACKANYQMTVPLFRLEYKVMINVVRKLKMQRSLLWVKWDPYSSCALKKDPFLKAFEINSFVSGARLRFSLSSHEETSRSETEQAECQCPKRLRAQSAKAPGTETTGTRRQSLNYITVSVKIIKQNAVTQIMLSFGH